MEYADEPRLIFSPLKEEDYCTFYDIEMQDYREDFYFYRNFIEEHFNVLELGCGSGRLSRLFASCCRSVTGIDISPLMIEKARKSSPLSAVFHLGDMTSLYLGKCFDSVIIPYNSLNLLRDTNDVRSCLKLCHKHLRVSGKLLLQLYHPDRKLTEAIDEKFFQFTIFEPETNRKLIKETIKNYDSSRQSVTLIERYRDRYFDDRDQNRDLMHTIHLFTPPYHKWRELLIEAGFRIENCWGDYTLSPFLPEKSTSLLISATSLSNAAC